MAAATSKQPKPFFFFLPAASHSAYGEVTSWRRIGAESGNNNNKNETNYNETIFLGKKNVSIACM